MTLLSGTTESEWTVIQWTIGISTVIQLGWYVLWEHQFADTERQRAYVLCVLSSTVMTLGSLPYFYQIIGGQLDVVLVANDYLAVALTTFFMTFLVWDLIVGVFRYRSKIDPLTGWVHHGTYLCMLTWVLNQHYSGLFIGLCVMELPTLFLSLGSVHAPWRYDYVFAAAFVLTRIVFHGYALACAVRLFGIGSSIVFSLAAVLPVHIYWFVGFIQQQKRLYLLKCKEAAAAATSTATTTAANTPTPSPRRSFESRPHPAPHVLTRRTQGFPGSYISNHPTVHPALVSAH